MTRPLRESTRSSDDEGPESPEALVISALLEQGAFDPGRWRLSDEDLACWQPLWHFCCDHQQRTGRAPALSLIRRKYPEFEVTADVDPGWAAQKLREAASERDLRRKVHDALAALSEQDVNEAFSALEGLQPPAEGRKPPVDAFDPSHYEEKFDVPTLEVPYDTIGRATGGFGAGQMWSLGARSGQGKTNVGIGAWVPRWMKSGASVGVFSREMPADEISHMALRGCAMRHPGILAKLDSNDRQAKKQAVDELREKIPGALSVFDPSHGPCTVEVIRDALQEFDVVVIDHVGLMTTRSGGRFIDDRRVAASISNRLKEEVLRYSGRLFLLVQVNRAGESMSPLALPKASDLHETDALTQDSDVIVTMNRYSPSVMFHGGRKVHRGPEVRWFSKYQPHKADFTPISRQQADEMQMADEDRESAAR
jgi:hypothetical protein